MNIIGWIVVGLIAGGLARMATGAEKRGCLGTLIVGIIGAVIGGALFSLASGDNDVIDDFDLGSIFVAFVGAALLLLLLQALDPGARGGRRRP